MFTSVVFVKINESFIYKFDAFLTFDWQLSLRTRRFLWRRRYLRAARTSGGDHIKDHQIIFHLHNSSAIAVYKELKLRWVTWASRLSYCVFTGACLLMIACVVCVCRAVWCINTRLWAVWAPAVTGQCWSVATRTPAEPSPSRSCWRKMRTGGRSCREKSNCWRSVTGPSFTHINY